MSTHNLQFHDKIRKNHSLFVFLSYWKKFVGTEKRVRIIQGNRAIRVPAIEVILYLVLERLDVHQKSVFAVRNIE